MRVDPKVAINFVAVQLAWFACVLGGANDRAFEGTLVVGAVIVLHLMLTERALPEAMLIAVAAVVGLAWDSLVVALGLMSYPSGNFAPGLAPYWIVAMWALFATSLNLSMAWLKGRPWLAALFGAVGGPLAYLAGARLGGLQMPDTMQALGMQALGWAVLLPVLVRLAGRLNGFEPAAPAIWPRVPQFDLSLKSFLAVSALMASLAIAPASPVNASVGDGVRKLSFDVFLDDRAIGYQRFELTSVGDGTRIQTQAEFEVKLLMITAFAYDHRNTELWRDGCLQTIDSQTDANGKKYTVSGRARGSEFVVSTDGGERTLDDCVATFAYWDKDVLLQRPRLLNSQTGEYVPVRIDALGPDRVRIGGRDVAVERYALRGQGLDITLAYSVGRGDWVALDSRLEGGRTLSYRRSPGELGVPSASHVAGRSAR
jgi:hypothetical protein